MLKYKNNPVLNNRRLIQCRRLIQLRLFYYFYVTGKLFANSQLTLHFRDTFVYLDAKHDIYSFNEKKHTKHFSKIIYCSEKLPNSFCCYWNPEKMVFSITFLFDVQTSTLRPNLTPPLTACGIFFTYTGFVHENALNMLPLFTLRRFKCNLITTYTYRLFFS